MRRKRRKRGAFSCAASRTNWRTVSSVTCAHTVRLSLKHALMHLEREERGSEESGRAGRRSALVFEPPQHAHPVGVMSYETRFASVWSTKRGIDATSSVCISGKSVHIALSSRYAARRTARISNSSALISLFSNGRLARRVSAGVCAFRFISSICMSWLVPEAAREERGV